MLNGKMSPLVYRISILTQSPKENERWFVRITYDEDGNKNAADGYDPRPRQEEKDENRSQGEAGDEDGHAQGELVNSRFADGISYEVHLDVFSPFIGY